MTKILIIGSGGHGKVVADILLSQGLTVAGFLDDNPAKWNVQVLGLPVLGPVSTLTDHEPSGVVLAIGSNHARHAIAARLKDSEVRWLSAIHPSATVSRSARLGQGIVIAAGVVLNPDCWVGDHAIINVNATVDHECIVDAYAHLAPGCQLAGDVRVGIGAHLGVGVAVRPSCIIGAWATIDAGAAVNRDIPENVFASGVPATWKALAPAEVPDFRRTVAQKQ